MIKGLVSVIIPTYNRAHFIVDAIHSAQAQDYPAKQIIVVDDGSDDETRPLVTALDGVEYHYQGNRGQGAARNAGLRLARGEYIASLDADDLWNADFLSQSVRCLEAYNLDFVFSDWQKVRQEQLYPSEWRLNQQWQPYQSHAEDDWFLLTPSQVRKLFLSICPAPSSSLLVRRSSIIEGWGEQMLIADDWYLILEMVLQRPCRAAFSLTPRWQKRVDGQNVYDGQPAVESIRKLYLHDQRLFRKDFNRHLTGAEKVSLASRELKYRVYLRLRGTARGKWAVRVRVPLLVPPLRWLARWIMRQS